MPLRELQRGLEQPLIEVWIGALLGGFVLEQEGSFYQGEVMVGLREG